MRFLLPLLLVLAMPANAVALDAITLDGGGGTAGVGGSNDCLTRSNEEIDWGDGEESDQPNFNLSGAAEGTVPAEDCSLGEQSGGGDALAIGSASVSGSSATVSVSASGSLHGKGTERPFNTAAMVAGGDIVFTVKFGREVDYTLTSSDQASGSQTTSEAESGAGMEDRPPTGTLGPGRYSVGAFVSCDGFLSTTASGIDQADFDCSGSASVSVTLTDSAGDTGDNDGDGLLNVWEIEGYDHGDDGIIDVDLPAMGASPDHKDVFVEVDPMDEHRIPNAELGFALEAFRRAPVTNPDGVDGINLHVDNGPASVMNPNTGTAWGSLSEQTTVSHQTALGTTDSNGDYDWSAVDAIKATGFDEARKPVFHYALSIHDVGGQGVGGLSRDFGASDFLVSQGRTDATGAESNSSPDTVAKTFMHELGHNLGLRHGGADDVNGKPNYLSIMNYRFGGWLWREDGVRLLDFSRFVVPFDEAALDEDHGFGFTGGDLATLMTSSTCPDGSTEIRPLRDGPVDWDCDGDATGGASLDVSGDTGIDVLSSQTDWDKLVYDGGLVGADAGDTLPATTPVTEPSRAAVEAAEQTFTEHFDASPSPSPAPIAAPPTATATPSPTATLPPTVAPARAKLTKLRVKPKRVRAGRRGRVSFRLDHAARVTLRIQRRVGRRWRTRPGEVRANGRGGANRVTLRTDKLTAGRYRLVATPAGGDPVRTTFSVRRPR